MFTKTHQQHQSSLSLSLSLSRALVHKTLLPLVFTLTSLLILSQSITAHAEVIYPANTPTGEQPGGWFNTYFTNMYSNPCTDKKAISGFKFASNYNAGNFVPDCIYPIASGFTGALARKDNYIPMWVNNGTQLIESILYQTGAHIALPTDKKVGIATTDPQTTLHIKGQQTIEHNNTQLILKESDNPNPNAYSYIEHNNNIFSVGSNNGLSSKRHLNITSDGKVGIGTDNPKAALDVNGSLRIAQTKQNFTNINAFPKSDPNNALLFGGPLAHDYYQIFRLPYNNTAIPNANSALVFNGIDRGSDPSDTSFVFGSTTPSDNTFTPIMTIQGDTHNVGIGTHSPKTKLTIRDDLSSSSSHSDVLTVIGNPAGKNEYIGMSVINENTTAPANSNRDFSQVSAATQRPDTNRQAASILSLGVNYDGNYGLAREAVFDASLYSSGLYINNRSTSGDTRFGSRKTEHMRIQRTTGNVGIGTPKPYSPLHIATTNQRPLILQNTEKPHTDGLLGNHLAFADKNNEVFGYVGDGSAGKQINLVGHHGYDVHIGTYTGNTSDTRAGMLYMKGDTGYIGMGINDPSNRLEVAGKVEADAYCDRNGQNCFEAKDVGQNQDFRVCVQLGDYGACDQRGSVECSPWASEGGGWTNWATDSDHYDPDCVRIQLETRSISTAGCNANQHEEGGFCVLNERFCKERNGSGLQNWDGSSWGSCQLNACDMGYILQGGSCVVDPTTPTTPSTGGGSCGLTVTDLITPNYTTGYTSYTGPTDVSEYDFVEFGISDNTQGGWGAGAAGSNSTIAPVRKNSQAAANCGSEREDCAILSKIDATKNISFHKTTFRGVINFVRGIKMGNCGSSTTTPGAGGTPIAVENVEKVSCVGNAGGGGASSCDATCPTNTVLISGGCDTLGSRSGHSFKLISSYPKNDNTWTCSSGEDWGTRLYGDKVRGYAMCATLASSTSNPTSSSTTNPGNGSSVSVTDAPSGIVMPFNLTTCPSGWKKFTAAENRFIRGAGTEAVGIFGGSATHEHNVVIPRFGWTSNGGGGANQLGGSTNHSLEDHTIEKDRTLTSAPASSLPPYVNLLYCEKESGGTSAPSVPSATVPSGTMCGLILINLDQSILKEVKCQGERLYGGMSNGKVIVSCPSGFDPIGSMITNSPSYSQSITYHRGWNCIKN